MDVFPNWTVFPIIVIVMLLTWILNRTFFKPLGRTLEERHRRIEGARIEAEEIRRASSDRLQEFEKRMRDARRESDQQMALIKNEAISQRNEIVSARRSETDKMLSEARSEIRSKSDDARKSLERQSQSFAQRIASQILKRAVQQKPAIQQ